MVDDLRYAELLAKLGRLEGKLQALQSQQALLLNRVLILNHKIGQLEAKIGG